jgi:hypothetical protein
MFSYFDIHDILAESTVWNDLFLKLDLIACTCCVILMRNLNLGIRLAACLATMLGHHNVSTGSAI